MSALRGIVVMLALVLATVVGCIPLFVLGLVRMIVRGPPRRWLMAGMHAIVQAWVAAHAAIFRLLGVTRLHVQWPEAADLSPRRWYLVISNHQSWADILILQSIFRGRIPILKFFTKRQLIWVPLIGLTMWFLGFPYVRRLSREQIAADPSLAELDRRATLQASQGFRELPTTVLSFLEGTRFTPAKHAAQEARFDHLLNPKLGGVSYVVTALGDRLDKVMDVTITYPGAAPSFWELLEGRCARVDVLVEAVELPEGLEKVTDPDTARALLRPWIESLWRAKDARLARANGAGG